jgi:lipoic acid synthetase
MNPVLPKNDRLPSWFRQEIPDDKTLNLRHLFSEFAVNTVCQEARCPNLGRCFKDKKVTFMILGDSCTRNCRFCGVNKGGALTLDEDEPQRVSRIVRILDLRYVVITSVTRDDLPDGGAGHFAKCAELIRGIDRGIKVEVLIPDFQGKLASLKCVLDSGPQVLAHNIETASRLYKDLRPQADYRLSLEILGKAKELQPSIITKSSIMLGLGETEGEVISSMEDLRENQCHYPIREFIDIGQFRKYRQIGIILGFKAVLSGPLVRSSYNAEDIYRELLYV